MNYANFFYLSVGVAVWVFTLSLIFFVILGIFVVAKINQISKRIKEISVNTEVAREIIKYSILTLIDKAIDRMKGGD